MSSKAGWTRVAFGDVVRLARERSSNPEKDGFERYVGLEHIDPGDLTIRRWGNVADGTTFTNVFRGGQVLFGKRRAYQRKVAVADFDGICSGDIYVFEPKDNALLSDLLPFICQTDRFFEHAIGTSAGSLSPRTNWTSLAEFEFPLPPLDEQRRIVRVLSASHAQWRALTLCHLAASQVHRALLGEIYDQILEEVPLQSVSLPIVRGIDSPGQNLPDGVPYVRIAEMTGPDGIVVSRLRRTSTALANAHPESRLLAGDIVVALRGVVGLAVSVPPEAEGANLSRGTARVSVASDHNRDFVFWALHSPRVRRLVLRDATGWKGEDLRELTLAALRELPIPLPRRSDQDRFAQLLTAAATAVKQTAHRARQSHAVLSKIIASALAEPT